MQRRKLQNDTVRRMVMIAMFTALAYVTMLVIHIKVGFLTFDLKDAVTTFCGLFFGPLAALFVAVVVPLIELATVSDTGVYGLIMNILSSVTFSVTVALIYKYKKTLWGAIAALLSGAALMVGVMMVANLLITPYYMGVTTEAVRELIPTLLLPFNALKAMVNVGAVLLLYKPLSRALRRAGLLPASAKSTAGNAQNEPRVATKSNGVLKSVLVTVAAVLLITGAMVLIFVVMGGEATFGV